MPYKNPPPCTAPGCTRPVNARGLCGLHYSRKMRSGTIDAPAPRKERAPCTMDGCDIASLALGMCGNHYRTARRVRLDLPPKPCRACRREFKPKSHQNVFCSGSCGNRAACLRRTFGIEFEDWYAKLDAQGGVCAICRRTENGARAFVVDHDHATGALRGIICTLCNLALGGFRDNPAFLRSAIAYLAEHGIEEINPTPRRTSPWPSPSTSPDR